MTRRYRIYGLNVSCDLPIPGLDDSESSASLWQPAISLQLGAQPAWARDALLLPSVIQLSLPRCTETQDPAFVLSSLGDGQYFHLCYSDGAHFVVDAEATQIWGAAGVSQTIEDLSTYLLGPVMGYILRRRGVTALHASAVCLDDKAVVFTGAAGAGKSTSAAALALRGLPVLCEDIAAIEELDAGFLVQPGYPRVCLWPASVEMLLERADALPRIAPNWDKRFLPLDGAERFERQARPLGAVYILAPREAQNAPRVEEINGRELLLELVQNTYMNWLLERHQRATEFELLSRLASQVPVRRIVPHRDPAQLPSLCELLVADATRALSCHISMTAAAGRR